MPQAISGARELADEAPPAVKLTCQTIPAGWTPEAGPASTHTETAESLQLRSASVRGTEQLPLRWKSCCSRFLPLSTARRATFS